MIYTLRPTTPADYPRMVEITNAQLREPITVEELARGEEQRPKEMIYLSVGAYTEDGLLLGFGEAQGGLGRRPGEFWARVRVDEPYWNQGIGSALFNEVHAFAKSHGATRLESAVREDYPESAAWTERRGFVQEHHLFESTLSLPDLDLAPFLEAKEAVLVSGIRFTTLAAEMEDGDRLGTIRRFYEFVQRLVKDIPGHADRPDFPWELFLKWVQTDPKWKDDLVLLAADGDRWVALCQLNPQPSGALYNGFTAVDREYRGRGLALAIKTWSLEVAKATGAPYVRTNNHSVNAPMLAVNRRLGYQPLPGRYQIAAAI